MSRWDRGGEAGANGAGQTQHLAFFKDGGDSCSGPPARRDSTASPMPDYPHLPNAPIQEALIDFRCKLPDGFSVSTFKNLSAKIGDAYPNQKPRRVLHAQFGLLDEEAFASADQASVDGYLFSSVSGDRIAQYRRDGFTYNWLRPYETWDALRTEALVRWRDYLSIVTPEEVTRIAVRYINRFSVDLPVRLRTLLRVPPELPPQVPNAIAQFLFKWVVDDPETGARCNITQSSEESSEGNSSDIILDIDCFVMRTDDNQFDPGSDELWDKLDELRALKNRIFFNSLTPEALEMFG